MVGVRGQFHSLILQWADSSKIRIQSLISVKFFQLTDINVHKTINSFHVYLHEWPVHESSLKEKTGCDELLGDTNNLIMSFDWML